ncbi:MAG: hypothetical protein ACRBN8_20025 [Nannocystales bacterium]
MNAPQRKFDPLSVSVTLPADSHPPHVVQGAAVSFIDRCYVLMDRPSASEIRVTLSAKEAVEDEGTLAKIADAFEARLLSSDLYHRVAADNQVLTDAVVAQAFGFGEVPASSPGLEDLEAFDFSEDAFDDPLGIAQTWEEKHGRPAPEAPTAATETKEEDSK